MSRRDIVNVYRDAEIDERHGEAGATVAVHQVGGGEHAEEVDGGEVEELGWGKDEDSYREGFGGGGWLGRHGVERERSRKKPHVEQKAERGKK